MTAPPQPWYLPPTVAVRAQCRGSVRELPDRPSAALISATVEALDGAAAALTALPVRSIIAAIHAALARLATEGDPFQQAVVAHGPGATGYSVEALRYALDVMLPRFGARGLWELLVSELGAPDLLDGFVTIGRTARMVRGLGRQLHVLAGSVPTVGIVSLICALLSKSPVLVKPASGDALLPALFAQCLAAIDPVLARALAVLCWPGGDQEIEAIALRGTGAVIAYGSDASVRSLQARTPASARFIGYGNRLSVAAIACSALTEDRLEATASRLAWDVALFDQRGCLAPQIAFVERSGHSGPEALCEALARHLESLARSFPRGNLTPARAARVRSLREAAVFRAGLDPACRVWQSERSTNWTVIQQPTLQDAAAGDRVLTVIPVDSLAEELPSRCAGLPIATIGLAAPGAGWEDLRRVLAGVAQRLCPLGRMGEPPITWRHDGRPNLADLVTWIDCEQD